MHSVYLYTVFSFSQLVMFANQSALPSPEEDDSLSAREEESAWSCESPSIRGMESSEEGTEES